MNHMVLGGIGNSNININHSSSSNITFPPKKPRGSFINEEPYGKKLFNQSSSQNI